MKLSNIKIYDINLIGDFQNPMVKLAFCRSEFIKNGIKIYSTDEYLRDLPSLDASEHFIISANDFVRLGMSVKNVIPNVSSVLFRRTDEMISDVVHNNWKTLKLCGDWLFYLDFIAILFELENCAFLQNCIFGQENVH